MKYDPNYILSINGNVCNCCSRELKISHQDGLFYCTKCGIITDIPLAKNTKKEKVGIMFDWEEIYHHEVHSTIWMTERAKVIGGWLVRNERVIHEQSSDTISESMVFVPDPDHLWKVE